MLSKIPGNCLVYLTSACFEMGGKIFIGKHTIVDWSETVHDRYTHQNHIVAVTLIVAILPSNMTRIVIF